MARCRRFHLVLAALLVGALATVAGLAGCGSGSGSGGFWALQSVTEHTAEGTATIVWTFDEEGRCLSTTWTETDGTGRTTAAEEFDAFGSSVVTEVTYYDAAGNVTRTRTDTSVHTWLDGKLVQADDNDGVSTFYTYHDNGMLASSDNSQGYVNGFDERGRKIHYDGGFLNRDGRGALTITYDEAASGAITGWWCSFANGQQYHYTCDLDRAGNIVAVYDPDGNLVMEAQYVRIANPCPAMQLYNLTRVGTFLIVNAIERYLGI